MIDFIKVLFQDIHDELNDKRADIPSLNENTPIEAKWAYCHNNFAQYREKTAGKFNFAGTPEALAIAYCLNRPLAIFGNDPVGAISLVRNTQTGKILPLYEKKEGEGTTIRIYQNMDSGGHYQILHPPTKQDKKLEIENL